MSVLFRERRAMTPSQMVAERTRLRLDGTTTAYRGIEAIQFAAVVAATSLRSGAFAQLPLRGYRGAGAGQELLATQPPLLLAPSPTVPPSVWKTQMSISRDLWGFAAGIILALDGAAYPAAVEWLAPDQVSAHQEYFGGPLLWKYRNEELDPSMVMHIPSRFVLPGNPVGISPLEQSGLVHLAKRAQKFGAEWFLNGSMPSAIIYSDEKLTQDQADGIVERVLAKWSARRPAVLGSGLRYEPQKVNAEESQFLATLTKAAADVAISFNLPPAKIAAAISGSSVTYQNLEQAQAAWLMDSMNPDLVITQEVIERHMRRGHFPRWQTGAFLRSDLKTRYDSYSVGISAGFLTVNEARAWEDLPPLPDATDGGAP